MSLVKLSLVFLAAHLLTALYFVLDRAPGTAAAWVGLPLDDAWIHMVYARSLAALHGFAYNPGQLETGSTSPLWAALLVPASWVARLFHVGVALPAKVTCIATAAAASVAGARLVRGLGLGLAAELVAGLAIACDPTLAFAQVSGMEVMLAAALGLAALAELAHQRYRLAALAAALAPLARPEMALMTVLVLALAEWRLRQSPLRVRLGVVLPTLVSLGAWVGYCLAVSGYPLPSTFYGKFASNETYLVLNLVLIVRHIVPALPWFVWGLGLLLWLAGCVELWRRGTVARVLVAFPLLFLLGVSASQYLRLGDAFYYLRYLLPAEAFIVVTLAVGGVAVLRRAWQRRSRSWGAAAVVGASLLVSAPLLNLPHALAERADLYAWNCQNIEELNVAMALWLRDNVPAGETIMVNDAGAARYFSRHRIFDMMGLNHHAFLHAEPAAVAELARVRFASVFPSWWAQLTKNATWQPIHRTSTRNLTLCRCDQSEIVAYRLSP